MDYFEEFTVPRGDVSDELLQIFLVFSKHEEYSFCFLQVYSAVNEDPGWSSDPHPLETP